MQGNELLQLQLCQEDILSVDSKVKGRLQEMRSSF